MSIDCMIALLMYLLILVLAYEAVILINIEEEKADMIINAAFKYAYFIQSYCLFIIYILIVIPHIVLDQITIAYLLLGSKYLSVLTLGGSIFLLSRKRKCNGKS